MFHDRWPLTHHEQRSDQGEQWKHIQSPRGNLPVTSKGATSMIKQHHVLQVLLCLRFNWTHRSIVKSMLPGSVKTFCLKATFVHLQQNRDTVVSETRCPIDFPPSERTPGDLWPLHWQWKGDFPRKAPVHLYFPPVSTWRLARWGEGGSAYWLEGFHGNQTAIPSQGTVEVSDHVSMRFYLFLNVFALLLWVSSCFCLLFLPHPSFLSSLSSGRPFPSSLCLGHLWPS